MLNIIAIECINKLLHFLNPFWKFSFRKETENIFFVLLLKMELDEVR
jgi:hypothetical protein